VIGWPPRFCVACGGRVVAAKALGAERRQCRRCGWTFDANPVPAAVALIVRAGRILLTRRAHPPHRHTWDLAGGFLEADETPETGFRRELTEELGMRIRRARFLGFATDRYGSRGFPVLTLIYRVTPVPGSLRPADDVAEARWFSRDRIPYGEVGFPSVRRLLRGWVKAARRRSRPGRAGSP
jgi:8-oxo-dGTP diphosphatase